jgi:hypothetical protein
MNTWNYQVTTEFVVILRIAVNSFACEDTKPTSMRYNDKWHVFLVVTGVTKILSNLKESCLLTLMLTSPTVCTNGTKKLGLKVILVYFKDVRFQVLTAASMKFRVFWDVLPCSQVDVNRRFRCAYCLHHQGDEWALREKITGYAGVQVYWADQWGMGDDGWGSGPMTEGWAVQSIRERERGV